MLMLFTCKEWGRPGVVDHIEIHEGDALPLLFQRRFGLHVDMDFLLSRQSLPYLPDLIVSRIRVSEDIPD